MDQKNIRASLFLQSSAWEEMGKKEYLAAMRMAGTLIFARSFPGGFHYLYCPRPLGEDFLQEARAHAKKSGAVFLKIDPVYPLKRVRGVASPSLQPAISVVTNLTGSEKELLAAMHEKTRYNIRLAERRGVEIDLIARPVAADTREIFWRLLQETAHRRGFAPHTRRHYDALFDAGGDGFANELFIARLGGKALAAALINFYGNAGVATYLHGGSLRLHQDAMPSHLLHWRVMQEAKRRGMRGYDLWGIDEVRWPGLTRFKLGFGGAVIQYPRSVDIVYRPFHYWTYRSIKKVCDYGSFFFKK